MLSVFVEQNKSHAHYGNLGALNTRNVLLSPQRWFTLSALTHPDDILWTRGSMRGVDKRQRLQATSLYGRNQARATTQTCHNVALMQEGYFSISFEVISTPIHLLKSFLGTPRRMSIIRIDPYAAVYIVSLNADTCA